MSIFLETNHLFLRKPSDDVANCVAMRDAGFKAIFCNIGDHSPDEWETIRQNARNAGIYCGPWLRTSDANHEFDPNRLQLLLDVSDDWESPLIVNSETELKGSGDDLTEYIANKVGTRDAAISMECWPFADVDWKPIAHLPVLLQIFPQESDNATRPYDCRAKWWEYGVKCVLFTFGSYRGQSPTTFDRLTPYGVYTGDDCGGNFQAWADLGTHDPCQEVEIFMEQIGSDHGITAFVDWLQKQPGMPTRKPSYNPKDPATWPWPERLERTLNMLREDHDEMASK